MFANLGPKALSVKKIYAPWQYEKKSFSFILILMEITKIHLKSFEECAQHINKGIATLYFSSQTSTVMPFDLEQKLTAGFEGGHLALASLASMPGKLELLDNGSLKVTGAVTWKEARLFCREKGRMVMTSPTEDLALILAGIATSCTGERCFGLGTLRDQLEWVKFIDFQGQPKTLNADKPFANLIAPDKKMEKLLLEYQEEYAQFSTFKNAPYPRFKVETDLMTGTEGQLGVIVEAQMKTLAYRPLSYLFIKLPKWEQNMSSHLKIFEIVQPLRHKVFSCELLDENSLRFLPHDWSVYQGSDLIFLETSEDELENIYQILLESLPEIPEEDMFVLDETRCKELRMAVPRAIFEANSKMGVTKQGTDVQVGTNKLPELLDFYKKIAQSGIDYNLFGHFGDAHLHFNFMPTKSQTDLCQQLFYELYDEVKKWKGSPFAEHGIGLLKRPYIASFYQPIQREFFKQLKVKFDPKNQFFPHGFMMFSKDEI